MRTARNRGGGWPAWEWRRNGSGSWEHGQASQAAASRCFKVRRSAVAARRGARDAVAVVVARSVAASVPRGSSAGSVWRPTGVPLSSLGERRSSALGERRPSSARLLPLNGSRAALNGQPASECGARRSNRMRNQRRTCPHSSGLPLTR